MDNGKAIIFWSKSETFLAELSTYLKGKTALEVFAGNGFLAHQLSVRGAEVKATSLFAGHDGHQDGLHHPVEEMDATQAIVKFGEEADVLLMSWPTATDAAYKAILAWGTEKPVVYIGETPCPELPGMSGLSGCASDEFFEVICWQKRFSTYRGNLLEKAGVIRLSKDKLAASEKKKPASEFKRMN